MSSLQQIKESSDYITLRQLRTSEEEWNRIDSLIASVYNLGFESADPFDEQASNDLLATGRAACDSIILDPSREILERKQRRRRFGVAIFLLIAAEIGLLSFLDPQDSPNKPTIIITLSLAALLTITAITVAIYARIRYGSSKKIREIANVEVYRKRQILKDIATKAIIAGLYAGHDQMIERTYSHVISDPDYHSKYPHPGFHPLGVSNEGAEEYIAEWIRYLGDPLAERTRFTGDGGLDVVSPILGAQVKNYTGAVPVAAIRELYGVCQVEGLTPLFFTSGNYSSGCIEFADRAGVALFTYNVFVGDIYAINDRARAMLRNDI